MSTPYKILVGDTDTPQARIPKSGEQTYLAPVTVDDATGVENCFEIEVTVQQSGTAGYVALPINITETSVGSGVNMLADWRVGGVSVFSVDNAGNVIAANIVSQTTGTFTPTIQDSSNSDAEGQTYSVQAGHYVKTGKMVAFNIRLTVTSIGTLSGTAGARIAGLPFAVATDANNYASVSVGTASSTGTGTGVITGWLSGTQVRLKEWNSHTGVATTSDFTVTEYGASGEIWISGTYWTD